MKEGVVELGKEQEAEYEVDQGVEQGLEQDRMREAVYLC